MKTKVLFILPSKGTGGIISSFIPLYNSIKEKIEVKILFLSPEDKADISFDDSVIKDTLLSLYYQNYSSLGFFQKVCAIYLKLIKRKNQANGNDMSFWVGKCVAKRLMRQYQFDMVVGFSEGAPTKLAACFIGAKKVSWIHCDYKRYYDVVCRVRDEYPIYRNIDEIVCVSDYTCQSFCAIYPSLAGRVRSINNLLDTERIKAMSIKPIEDKRFNNDLFTLISVGRIDPVKCFSCIPQIARHLKDLGLKFRWYILGPDSNVSEAYLLKSRITEYEVSDTVYWLGGKSNPYAYMSRCNLYVCLSQSEACPMVFNEAKVLGLPIVSTNFGSAYEFLKNGIDGIITDLDSIEEVLMSLLGNSDEYNSLNKGVKAVSYSNTPIIQRLNELFQVA